MEGTENTRLLNNRADEREKRKKKRKRTGSAGLDILTARSEDVAESDEVKRSEGEERRGIAKSDGLHRQAAALLLTQPRGNFAR